jgi:cell division protein FtsB
MPRVAETRWNYSIRTVNIVFENRDALIECFEEIEEKSANKVTLTEASGLRRILSDPEFIFWLHVFHKILIHVDILYQQLQARNKDSSQLRSDIDKFEQEIAKERLHIDDIDKEIEHEFPEPSRKRKKEDKDVLNQRSVSAKEICDVVASQVKDRFSYTGHLEAAILINNTNFELFNEIFPQTKLENACLYYPMLDSEKLKTELQVMYKRNDFREIKGAVSLKKYFNDNNLNEIFSETSKLLNIIITSPMSTAESERCFSSLKRIKSFLRNTMKNDRLNALAMIAINRKMVNEIDDFDDRVLEKFVTAKQRRMDFVYKV